MKLQENKSIVWLTGDYFVDVDMLIVPELKKHYDITWIVIRTEKSQREVSFIKEIDDVVTIKHKSLSPLCLFDYSRIIKRIKKICPDILYIDYLGMPYFFPLLIRKFDISKVIFMAHNVRPRPTWNRQYKWYYPYIFRHLRNVHVPSTHNISYIEEQYPKMKYTYIPMVVKSFGEAKEKFSDNGIVRFLFFGHVMNNKHLDHLIEAFKALPEGDKNKSELVVYGKCATPEVYINMLDGENNIHLHFGYVPNERIPELFTNASFLVLPYDNVDQSGPSMIAFNYYLPLICSDIDGFKEIVNDGVDGFLYAKNNVSQLSNTLHKCINLSGQEYNIIKENLKKHVDNNYSLEVIAQKYCAMFDNI